MANLSKASNIVQEKYVLYDVTSFTQKWHSIPVATNCRKTREYQDLTARDNVECQHSYRPVDVPFQSIFAG